VNKAQRRILLALGAGGSGILAGLSVIGSALPVALGFGAIAAASLTALAWDLARSRPSA
jgi:hypothetical protein